MLRAAVAIAILASASVVGADPVRVVDGVVLDRASHQPIAGATVVAEHAGIAVTDEHGHFTLALARAGGTPRDRSLTITAPGHASRTIAIEADTLEIELAPASGSEVIEVTSRAPEETRPLAYRLSADEIRQLPGAGNDVLRAAQALPGVARIPYAFGGLVLRGTSPRDTAVFLDGIEVPIAFHFGGISSFYPSGMLADLSLTAGGFEAEYGRAQGGIVTLTTREPRTDRWRAAGSLGLLDSGLMAEGPVAGGGITLGVRRSYFDTVLKPFVAADVPLPSYWDVQVRGSFGDPGRRGRVTPLLFLSIDQLSNSSSGDAGDMQRIAVTSMFVRAAIPYLRQWGPTTLHVVPWLGTNRLSFETTQDGQTERFRRPVYPAGLRADLTRDLTWGHLRGGVELSSGYLARSQVGLTGGDGPVQASGSSTLAWSNLAVWGETRVSLDHDRFAIKPGVRVEGYGLTDEVVVDPRLNIHQQLTDKITLRQAIGRFHQPPTPGDIDPHDGNPALNSSYFDQVSLGVDTVLGGYATSITGFFDYGRHLGVREPTGRPGDSFEPNLGGLGPTFELLLEKQLGFATYRRDIGRARSFGLELLVKRHVGRWFGLLSYTLSNAQRVDDPANGWRPFELDQRHNLNVAGSVQLGAWRLGARVQLVSGNPYSPTSTGVDPHPIPWGGTLPVFFQLDLRADRRWYPCWGQINLYLDVQNATNRRNVEGRQFGYDPDHPGGIDQDIPGLPIVPFLGLELLPR